MGAQCSDADVIMDSIIEEKLQMPTVAAIIGVHRNVPTRWVKHGKKSNDGRQVKLQAIRLGQGYITSKLALRAFLHDLTRR